MDKLLHSRAKNISETGLIQSGKGVLRGATVSSTTSGTLRVLDGTEASVVASSVLTSSGACVPASHAESVITASTVVDGNIVTIGSTVYRAKTTPAQAYDVNLGDNDAEFLDNLKLAINGTGVGDGTDYFTGTVAHPSVVATTNADTTQKVVARIPGTTPNTIVTTGTAITLVWADTTLGGGTGDSNPGVTTAAATLTIGTRIYTAVLALSETSGADAIADQILWVTSEAVFLDNVKKAINGSGVAGTNYSTGTTENADVYATTNTNTEQTIVAKIMGTVGNAIATSTTLANYAWTSTVMASGAGANATLIMDTITPAAGTHIDFHNTDLQYGLWIEVGNTIVATVNYN